MKLIYRGFSLIAKVYLLPIPIGLVLIMVVSAALVDKYYVHPRELASLAKSTASSQIGNYGIVIGDYKTKEFSHLDLEKCVVTEEDNLVLGKGKTYTDKTNNASVYVSDDMIIISLNLDA